MKRIDFFKNTKSQYGVLVAFTKGLQQALRRAKIASRTFDILTQSEGDILSFFAKDMPDCTIGFNVIPGHLSFEQLGVPHVALIVDCATHYLEMLECKNAIAGFVEEDSCGFFKLCGHKNVIFFPHAIDQKQLRSASEMKVKRDLDVVMCGSFSDAELIRASWKLLLSKKAQDFLLDAAEQVLASDHLTHLQIFVTEMEKKGFFAEELKEKGIPAFTLINWLEIYIRGIDRIRFIQAIEGHDIHIFGQKEEQELWKKALKRKKRLFFHEKVPYDKLPEVFLRTRAVINSMATIKRGLHERLLLGLSQGASVLSNDNIFIEKTFNQPKALLNIRMPDYSQANELLAHAFENEEERINDIMKAHKIIRDQHTFDVRVKMLQDTLPQMIQNVLRNQTLDATFTTAKRRTFPYSN